MKKAGLRASCVLAISLFGAAPGWAAGLKLTIHDGKVSLDAEEVTIRQILTEWARVGKTRVINLERVNSGPVTIQFEGVPEDQALDIILRSLPGYVAAPRTTMMADASIYDRILLMPTTTPVASSPGFRPQGPAGDTSSNVTQLRSAPTPLVAPPSTMNPGMLPEPPDYTDPAIAAAAAAGIVSRPATTAPANIFQPTPLEAPRSVPGALPSPNQPVLPPAPAATNPWNAPSGASQPGLAAPQTPSNPPSRPSGTVRPTQADQ